jgi:AraC-like DNA-binding protein
MKVETIRLHQEPYNSFIVLHEIDHYTPWHHHPEYELVLIEKGKGRRLVGDHVAPFEKNDLIFLGPYLPHQWICDIKDTRQTDVTQNEAFVIQFLDSFLKGTLFEIPENAGLKDFLNKSTRGIEFYGRTKTRIISILHRMHNQNDTRRFYSLLSIFEILGLTDEFKLLTTPNSMNNFSSKGNEPMQKAMQYILQNFQKKIQTEDLLEISHKSYASFYSAFKKAFQMPFKDYLVNVRVGYACKFLAEGSINISEIAYESGFENMSNFNRQFKKIKGVTPSQFQKQYKDELPNGHP